MENIVVIDTETTWSDKVMSIGLVIADGRTYEVLDSRYYLLSPECNQSGMYSSVLRISGTPKEIEGSRTQVMKNLEKWLQANKVGVIMAYNAKFDKNHLPELGDYVWCDIMKLAAYKQFNRMIADDLPLCKSGRLKTGYGVEPTYRRLSGNKKYFEKHNAWWDAKDELQIVVMLKHPLEVYLEHAVI